MPRSWVTCSLRVITNANHHVIYPVQKDMLVFDVTCHWVGPGVIHLRLVPLASRSDHFLNELTLWNAQRQGVRTDQAWIGPVGVDALVAEAYHEHVQIVLGIWTAKQRIERLDGLAGIGVQRVDRTREQRLRLFGRCVRNVVADRDDPISDPPEVRNLAFDLVV